eukprot:6637714-Prorocentrum_lima.AAC.1
MTQLPHAGDGRWDRPRRPQGYSEGSEWAGMARASTPRRLLKKKVRRSHHTAMSNCYFTNID